MISLSVATEQMYLLILMHHSAFVCFFLQTVQKHLLYRLVCISCADPLILNVSLSDHYKDRLLQQSMGQFDDFYQSLWNYQSDVIHM